MRKIPVLVEAYTIAINKLRSECILAYTPKVSGSVR